MFIVGNDDSSQDTFEELVWIPGIHEFMNIASDEWSEVPTKYDAIHPKYFVTILILMQSNINFSEFMFCHERDFIYDENTHSTPFRALNFWYAGGEHSWSLDNSTPSKCWSGQSCTCSIKEWSICLHDVARWARLITAPFSSLDCSSLAYSRGACKKKKELVHSTLWEQLFLNIISHVRVIIPWKSNANLGSNTGTMIKCFIQ